MQDFVCKEALSVLETDCQDAFAGQEVLSGNHQTFATAFEQQADNQR